MDRCGRVHLADHTNNLRERVASRWRRLRMAAWDGHRLLGMRD